VGSDGRQPTRRPPTSPESTSQVNPGRAADNPEKCTHDRLRAHTCGSGPRRQTTTVRGKTSKCVRRLQVEKALRLSHTWSTGRQGSRVRARARQENRDDALARPGGEASGQDHHTGRGRRGQENRRAMGEREGRQGGIWHLDVVDGRISYGRWESGSRSSLLKRRRVDGLLQLPRHRTNGSVRRRIVGNRRRPPKVRHKSGGATITRSHHSRNLQ